MRNGQVAVQYASALHFSRVCGQNRRNQCLIEKSGQSGAIRSARDNPLQREGDAARLRRRSVEKIAAAAAIVMHILGNVRKLRELAKCANHRFRRLVAQLIQHHVQFVPRLQVLLAPESNRGLANILDKIKSRLAFLLTQGIAQHTAKQADIHAKGIILGPVVINDVIFFEASARGSKGCHNATSS